MPLPPFWLALGAVKVGAFGYMSWRRHQEKMRKENDAQSDVQTSPASEKKPAPPHAPRGPVIISIDEEQDRHPPITK
jgi:hypothetical protein